MKLWNEDYAVFVDNVTLPAADNYIYLVTNLAAEAGECAGKLAKSVRDEWTGEKLDEELRAELGDVLWHVQALCNKLGISLEHLAKANQYKLESRLKRNKIGGSGDHR